MKSNKEGFKGYRGKLAEGSKLCIRGNERRKKKKRKKAMRGMRIIWSIVWAAKEQLRSLESPRKKTPASIFSSSLNSPSPCDVSPRFSYTKRSGILWRFIQMKKRNSHGFYFISEKNAKKKQHETRSAFTLSATLNNYTPFGPPLCINKATLSLLSILVKTNDHKTASIWPLHRNNTRRNTTAETNTSASSSPCTYIHICIYIAYTYIRI